MSVYIPKSAMIEATHDKEDALLNWLRNFEGASFSTDSGSITTPNPRWRSIARTHFEEGFMALRRSISGDRKPTGEPT